MKLLEKNVGGADKALRLIVGVALLGAVLLNYVAAPVSYVLGLIGLIMLFTGAMGSCALYSLFGISTAKKK